MTACPQHIVPGGACHCVPVRVMLSLSVWVRRSESGFSTIESLFVLKVSLVVIGQECVIILFLLGLLLTAFSICYDFCLNILLGQCPGFPASALVGRHAAAGRTVLSSAVGVCVYSA